jgi:uncharacterized protein DUF4340
VVAPEHQVRPRNTLVLLIVLLALGGYLYFVERPSQQREVEAKKLVSLKKDAVTGITLAYPDHTIVLEKSAEGHWRVTQPVAADADDPVVNNIVTAIAEADVSRTLDDVGDKLASYGLAPPEATITLTLKEGNVPPLKIGKTTQIGSAAYLQKGDDPKVYIGTMAFQSAMKKQVKDVRDKSLVTFEDQDVKKVELVKGGVDIMAERGDGDSWRITKPGDYPGDSSEFRALLASLRGLRADDFVSDDAAPDLAKYGLVDPQLRVAVWIGKDAAQKTLLLGGFKDDDPSKKSIYAKRAELPTVVTLPDYSIKNLDKTLSTLRDKTVLRFPKDQAAKLAVTRKDGNGFTLTKRDGAWHIEEPGEGAERAPTMTRFLDDIAGFKGTDIISEDPKADLREWGLGTPDMTIVVSDADGKPLGTLIGARGPEPAGDPNAKAFVSAVGSGIVYVVKPFVYDRIDKKRGEFRESPRPSPSVSPAAGAAPGAAMGADNEVQGGEGAVDTDIPGDDGDDGDDGDGAPGDDGGGGE